MCHIVRVSIGGDSGDGECPLSCSRLGLPMWEGEWSNGMIPVLGTGG